MDLTRFMRPLAAQRRSRLAALDPVTAQVGVMRSLVARARHTRFGRDHGFHHIRRVADFQRQVPLRSFDDLWKEYWQRDWPVLDDVSWPGRIPFFARSSGTTTGRTKQIPVTRGLVKANEGAGFDLMSFHLGHAPASRPLAGKSFILGGSTTLEEVAPGVFSGDVSGINTRLTPFWVRRNVFPPPAATALRTWEEKLDVYARLAIDAHVTMMAGMCNWSLFMLDRIRERRIDAGLAEGPTLPHLELFIHSGVPLDLYRDRLEQHFRGSRVIARELYAASEGFIAAADRGSGEGMRLVLDRNLFLEFIPLSETGSASPRRHWVADVERDVDYALALSNNAGLWAYLIGDVVRFVDTRPPRLLVMGRVAQMLSPFGEHLIGAEIDAAVRAGATAAGLQVAEYTVGPVFPDAPAGAGHHVYIVEPATATPAAVGAEARMGAAIDQHLRARNEDYDSARKGDIGVLAPRVVLVAPGSFEAWMRARGKLGGQHKVPRVTTRAPDFAALATDFGVALGTDSHGISDDATGSAR